MGFLNFNTKFYKYFTFSPEPLPPPLRAWRLSYWLVISIFANWKYVKIQNIVISWMKQKYMLKVLKKRCLKSTTSWENWVPGSDWPCFRASEEAAVAEESSWLTQMKDGLCLLCAVALCSLEADNAFPLPATQQMTSDLPNLALFPFQTDNERGGQRIGKCLLLDEEDSLRKSHLKGPTW